MPDVYQAVVDFLLTRPNGATVKEIEAAVGERVDGVVGTSTVRSFLLRNSDGYTGPRGTLLERPARGVYRLPAEARAPKRVLITGIPATGKTTLGHYLATQGYVHLDFEHQPTLNYFADNPDEIGRVVTWPRVVITWGFVPNVHLDYVLGLRDLGFRWIWFDGDRDAALRAYRARGSVEAFWDVQLGLIGKFIDADLDELGPRIVNVFDPSGGHRPSREIWSDIVG